MCLIRKLFSINHVKFYFAMRFSRFNRLEAKTRLHELKEIGNETVPNETVAPVHRCCTKDVLKIFAYFVGRTCLRVLGKYYTKWQLFCKKLPFRSDCSQNQLKKKKKKKKKNYLRLFEFYFKLEILKFIRRSAISVIHFSNIKGKFYCQ